MLKMIWMKFGENRMGYRSGSYRRAGWCDWASGLPSLAAAARPPQRNDRSKSGACNGQRDVRTVTNEDLMIWILLSVEPSGRA